MTPTQELLQLIDAFVSGKDRSRKLADEIEGLVLECFTDQLWFDGASLALAQYSPGGGKNYLSEDDLATELNSIAEALRGGSGGH